MTNSANEVAAHAVLNMFDYGIAHVINGVEVDRQTNALALANGLHWYFGAFTVYFDAVPGASNTYRIQQPRPSASGASYSLPITRELFVTDAHTIDSPSPRLLAVHRAIAHILYLSGAGEYIDKILRDMDSNVVRVDGSSELDSL